MSSIGTRFNIQRSPWVANYIRSINTRRWWPGRAIFMHKPSAICATYSILLSTDLAQTLACTLILTILDYCNSVLYGAPVSSIQKLQRVHRLRETFFSMRRAVCLELTS